MQIQNKKCVISVEILCKHSFQDHHHHLPVAVGYVTFSPGILLVGNHFPLEGSDLHFASEFMKITWHC